MKKIILSGIVFVVFTSGLFISSINAEENLIPSWIKTVAKFWAEDNVSDSEFIGAMQFLITNKIMYVPTDTTKINELEKRISNLEKTNSELTEELANLQERLNEPQSTETSNDNPFELQVISCSAFGTKSLQVEYSLKNNYEDTVSIQLVIRGLDVNHNVLSISTPWEFDIFPGMTRYGTTYIDDHPNLNSCGIMINDIS